MQDERAKSTRATPKRKGRTPAPGSVFASEALASNMRAYRSLRGLTQEQLARRMTGLGHAWTPGIVGFVERSGRTTDVDELAALAIALECTIGELLDPTGVDGRARLGLDVGSPYGPHRSPFVPGDIARLWTRSMAVVGWGEGFLSFSPVEGLEENLIRAIAQMKKHAEEEHR